MSVSMFNLLFSSLTRYSSHARLVVLEEPREQMHEFISPLPSLPSASRFSFSFAVHFFFELCDRWALLQERKKRNETKRLRTIACSIQLLRTLVESKWVEISHLSSLTPLWAGEMTECEWKADFSTAHLQCRRWRWRWNARDSRPLFMNIPETYGRIEHDASASRLVFNGGGIYSQVSDKSLGNSSADWNDTSSCCDRSASPLPSSCRSLTDGVEREEKEEKK